MTPWSWIARSPRSPTRCDPARPRSWVLDVGDGRGEAMEASNGAVFLGGHHRHSATLRESVDAVAYVARGFIGYAFMSMFCWDLNPDFEYAVFRSRDRAPAWARSMVEDEK